MGYYQRLATVTIADSDSNKRIEVSADSYKKTYPIGMRDFHIKGYMEYEVSADSIAQNFFLLARKRFRYQICN